MDEQKEPIQMEEMETEADLEQMDLMEPEDAPEWELPKARIAYVMAIVAVLCGGNGIGILAAGLHWKANGNLPVAIGIAVGVTALALVAVAIIVLVHKKRTKKKLEQ